MTHQSPDLDHGNVPDPSAPVLLKPSNASTTHQSRHKGIMTRVLTQVGSMEFLR